MPTCLYNCRNLIAEEKFTRSGTHSVTGTHNKVGVMARRDSFFFSLRTIMASVPYLGVKPVAKLSIATGHAMQIYNCLDCPKQLHSMTCCYA